MPRRVLILTASVGEGHDLPARVLAAQLRAEHSDVEVVTEDGLAPMGRVITAISGNKSRIVDTSAIQCSRLSGREPHNCRRT